MAVKVTKVDVWAGEIVDRAGGLAEKLEAVAEAGASLEFVVARRQPDRPGTGVVFMAPLKGAAQGRAAQGAGLSKTTSMHTIRIEGPDRPGLGAKITRAVADAGINLRGLSAAALGRQCVAYLAFDVEADAKKAMSVIKKAMAGK